MSSPKFLTEFRVVVKNASGAITYRFRVAALGKREAWETVDEYLAETDPNYNALTWKIETSFITWRGELAQVLVYG